MNEYIGVPQVEWVLYEDISLLTRAELWKRAVQTRPDEAIERLTDLLRGVRDIPLSVACKGPDNGYFVPKEAAMMAPAAVKDYRVLVIVTGKTPAKTVKPRDPFDVTFEEMMGIKSNKIRFDEKQELFLISIK